MRGHQFLVHVAAFNSSGVHEVGGVIGLDNPFRVLNETAIAPGLGMHNCATLLLACGLASSTRCMTDTSSEPDLFGAWQLSSAPFPHFAFPSRARTLTTLLKNSRVCALTCFPLNSTRFSPRNTACTHQAAVESLSQGTSRYMDTVDSYH